ncbi:hypothetical protein [Actinoplanes solisilvae]|uniref:hypothetical protein n=1 Tax=Actinoplanes solisilvae TaxID=2486853 RepID=UPI000FD81405|nr:hypothetical protein [Actinoplanes solisilvae]
MPSHTSRALATLAVVGIATGSAALAPSPAAAHPFGDPQTVAITPDGQRPDHVQVTWRVGGPDDLTLLGVSLGLLPGERAKADGTVDYRYTDPGVVGSSAKFTGYLLDRITVTGADARPCTGDVEPIHALALKGATVDYVCPGPVATATIGVRMLTDLNPAYRALATGPSGQRAVYDSATESHAWTLVGAPSTTAPGRSALWQLAAVIGAVLLAVAACLVLLRRRRVTA